MRDNFGWNDKKGAAFFGLLVGGLGISAVISQSAFGEFDYWAGTVALVVFALVEVILFAWVFGMNNAWREINAGADIKVPTIFKYLIKFVSPVVLSLLFILSLPDIVERAMDVSDTNAVIARILMVILFVGLSVMVYYAGKKQQDKKL